ncbi:MAG: hypothetical protein AAF219_10675 [Myxococcota bacterium]
MILSGISLLAWIAIAAAEDPVSPRDIDGTIEVSRRWLRASNLGRSPRVSCAPPFVVLHRRGHVWGLKIQGMRRWPEFESLGLRNGDTVFAINGTNLRSPERALEIYAELKQSDRVVLDIQRRAEPMRLRYRLVE